MVCYEVMEMGMKRCFVEEMYGGFIVKRKRLNKYEAESTDIPKYVYSFFFTT